MGATENITGLFAPVVAGGVALKFTQAALGTKKRGTRRAKRKIKKNSPW